MKPKVYNVLTVRTVEIWKKLVKQKFYVKILLINFGLLQTIPLTLNGDKTQPVASY